MFLPCAIQLPASRFLVEHLRPECSGAWTFPTPRAVTVLTTAYLAQTGRQDVDCHALQPRS